MVTAAQVGVAVQWARDPQRRDRVAGFLGELERRRRFRQLGVQAVELDLQPADGRLDLLYPRGGILHQLGELLQVRMPRPVGLGRLGEPFPRVVRTVASRK